MTTRRRSARLRKQALNRDGHRCIQCGLAGALEAHHRVALYKGGADTLANLETRCRSCHLAQHQRAKTPAEVEWQRALAELL